MSNKVYKSSMGKSVDMGALMLQNENVKAVGNMNVNARGDLVDSSNRVIDQKNRQVQRQYQRQTNVSATPVTQTNTKDPVKEAAKEPAKKADKKRELTVNDSVLDLGVPPTTNQTPEV